LAAAIRIATTDRDMRCRATKLGERLRSENGVAQAVAAFERHMKGPHESNQHILNTGTVVPRRAREAAAGFRQENG
jgi:hypothetical protein